MTQFFYFLQKASHDFGRKRHHISIDLRVNNFKETELNHRDSVSLRRYKLILHVIFLFIKVEIKLTHGWSSNNSIISLGISLGRIKCPRILDYTLHLTSHRYKGFLLVILHVTFVSYGM